MLAIQPRRLLSRPFRLCAFALLAALLYWVLLHQSGAGYKVSRVWQGETPGPAAPPPLVEIPSDQIPLPLEDSSRSETKEKPSPAKAEAGDEAKKLQEERDRQEKASREEFQKESIKLAKILTAGSIYGNTLATLVSKDASRKMQHEAALKAATETVGFSGDRPHVYNPYPHYNGKEWKALKRAEYVPCEGPDGVPPDDIMVFKGVPHDFPAPGFGSYDVLNMDGNLCFERDTRLGMYGYPEDASHTKSPQDWDKVSWGSLQERCLLANQARFYAKGPPNPYLDGLDSRANSTSSSGAEVEDGVKKTSHAKSGINSELKREKLTSGPRTPKAAMSRRRNLMSRTPDQSSIAREARTALLIRTYTGKDYSDNDIHIIRSLVTELALRTGGQYQVFLFVQVKDSAIPIWQDEQIYDWVLKRSVPPEFRDMTILWNDEATQSTYSKLNPKQATVHVAQWLSVQKFMQEFSEFEYVWNWELDSRVTSHHYDFLERLVAFAKKQPRRGLWERNERYYVPSIHGDYDTEFRNEVERRSVNGTVWGAPKLPFINPIGPKPPVNDPKDDAFEWGVGEEADLITVAPIFNPLNSSWIGWPDVWGYNDSSHPSLELPRRATIITQSRVSRRLLNIMHAENLRGNHISSEMTTQTVALLHGLKAVYAPMPIWFDRPWPAKSLEKWFNGGPNGESGGLGSAMGWGREGRFGGSTWYFRANPPQRLYTNWMGWEDTGIGGSEWEKTHGRPCLPPMLLHPIKNVGETEPGHSSESKLPYT